MAQDKNLWHLSHEGLDLEDTGNEPQYSNVRFLLHEDVVIKSPESKFSEDAYLKKYCGRGDCTPFLNMST